MSEKITIVSGLPRSGTSMMMRMLEAGGMDVVTDNERKADIDNPRGYYEFELVKKIESDKSWLSNAEGKAFKMVSRLLYNLPEEHEYQIIFMKRDMRQMLQSQEKMLERLGKSGGSVSNEQMAELFLGELRKIESWLSEQGNIQVIYLDYGDVVSHPVDASALVDGFLQKNLTVPAMAATVEPELHRNR
jgi:hypothetical protein